MFAAVLVVMAWVFGLMAGAVQWGVLFLSYLLTRHRTMRTKIVASIASVVLVSLGAGAVARLTFGDQATPLWLIAVIGALDVAGMLVLLWVAMGDKPRPTHETNESAVPSPS